MKTVAVIGLVYGGLVLAGGLIGYATTGSLPSAVAGGAFGIAILGSAIAMLKGKTGGWYAALGLTAVLTLFFGIRLWQGGAFMPTGLMATLSVIAVVLLVVLRRSRSRRLH